MRAILFGIAAVVMGFVLKSPGTQAGDIGSQPPVEGVRVASLGPAAGPDSGDYAQKVLPDTPASACRNASFDERFAALDDRAASFGERIASVDDRAASFGERFGLATEEITGSVRLPPDPDIEKAFRSMARLTDAPTASAASRHVRPGQARKDLDPPPDDDGRTAIYDITARAVYLPNGRKLEAHSGLGGFMDNPRHVHLKMRGATPPNVYNLSLRERLFHGVRAIRLTPVDSGRMYGRDGMLAHSYLHGPNGQSSGCVAFRKYPEFLNAFLKGDVTRLVVVERLENPPGPQVAAGWVLDAVRKLSGRVGQYAAADDH